MLRSPLATKVLFSLLTLVSVIGLQNCTSTHFQDTLVAASKDFGNGGAYEGKPDRYYYYEPSNPCEDVGANNKALPNKEIFIIKSIDGAKAQMVRNDCADLTAPLNLSMADLKIVGDGSDDFSYNGDNYQGQKNIGEFDVIAATCPTGYTSIPAALRQNMIMSSQYLLSEPWNYLTGLQGLLAGSLGSLPKFELFRNDPQALEWYRRTWQNVTLEAGKTYAFTFFGQKGTVNEAYLTGWQDNNMAVNVYFDLTTGAGRDVGTSGFSNLSFASRPFAGGYILTAFFTAPLTYTNAIGITAAAPVGPNGINDGPMGKVGDSIFATAVQLEEVSSYCIKL